MAVRWAGLRTISETDAWGVATGDGGWEGAEVTAWSLAWGARCLGLPPRNIQGLRKERGGGWRFEEGAKSPSWGHATLVLLQDRRTSGTVDKLGHGATDIIAIGARSHGFDEVRSQGKTGSHRWSRGNQAQRQWAEEEE